MTVAPFRGFALQGAWTWGAGERERFTAVLKALKDGAWEIPVPKRQQTQRSLKQNAFLWGVAYPIIADHLGYDHHEHESLHYDLLSVRFGTVAVIPKVPGASPRIVPAKTSSELTTTEMADYFEWLVRFAAEKWDVVIQLPDERV